MPYREDHEAALARAEALERELEAKDEELGRLRAALAERDVRKTTRLPGEGDAWLSAYLEVPARPTPPPPPHAQGIRAAAVDVPRDRVTVLGPAPRASWAGAVLAVGIAFVIISIAFAVGDCSRRSRTYHSKERVPPVAPVTTAPDRGARELRGGETAEPVIEPATVACDEVSCVLGAYEAPCCARWKPRRVPAAR